MEKLIVNTPKYCYIISFKEIVFCTSKNKKETLFVLSDNKEIIVPKPLKEFNGLLEHKGFIRPFHSYIINQNHINCVQKKPNIHIILTNGHSIPVSQNKAKEVFRLINQEYKIQL